MKFPVNRRILMLPVLLAASACWAMDDMTDGEMSDHVAQDGVTFRLILPDFDGAGPGTDVGFKINQTIFHDRDGYAGAPAAGAIVHGTGVAGDRLEFTMAALSVINASMDSVGDSSAAGGNQPMLNVRVDIPAFTFKTGKTYVAASSGVSSPVTSMSAAISESMTINVGAITANLQLAGESQGNMLRLTGSMTNGITATGYQLNDVNSGGFLQIPAISINNNGASTSLDVNIGVDVATNGVVARVYQLGASSGGVDIALSGVKVGDAGTPAIGNIDLVGLDLATTVIRVAGQP
ncbi:hypothetical protein EV700_1669 [Fluviicoccus keumensis]|uniref:Uncharacterized protein n=1 Tax=Fluviicoccus keumensis TaxID=1435465 RepID=A0A4Q7Z3R7_9GAMM|nr:hypothetical protein [Fluviicoccus keumensis]RZU44868.1 hypothetical protein EV700_1669 [Fluviicoccus keumensis]